MSCPWTLDLESTDLSLLHLQSIRRCDAERMIRILSGLMFDGVSWLSCNVMDWGLITALVQRWRPETHSLTYLSESVASHFKMLVSSLVCAWMVIRLLVLHSLIMGGTSLLRRFFGKAPRKCI